MYGQEIFWDPEERDRPKCFVASKASSGDFAVVLFSIGMPYYAKPKDGQSWSVIPETLPATYQVEEVH